MNREEVLEMVEPLVKTQVQTIEHRANTRINVTPEMVSLRPGGGKHHVQFAEEGIKSMTGFVGLPWNVAMGLRPETFGEVATELLGKKNRYALVTQEGLVTAVVKPQQYRGLNPDRVLRAIEQGVKGIEYHRALILDNFVVSLEVIGEKREPVGRGQGHNYSGDLIQAGANITFSPMGTVDPIVQSYVLRLICTNGYVHNTILREFKYTGGGHGGGGEGDDIWQWFRQSSKDAYNSIDQIVQRYREMVKEDIPEGQRAAMLEAMLKEAKLTGEDAQAIRTMAIEDPPRTTYDMLNLITNATSHVIESPARVRRAQLAAASFADSAEHARICPVCRNKRN